jgi:chromosome segregation ATPase
VSHASTEDIMRAVEALRRDVQSQGSDIRRLVEQHNDHERRITVLEPVKGQVDRLTEHVSEIGRVQTVILERLEGMERVVGDALRIGARELQTQLASTVRHELTGLREEVASLREELQARPCFQSGNCEVRDA